MKKIILSMLVLLMTAVTGAWAESKPIGLNVEYKAGDEITSTTDVYVYYGEQPSTSKQMVVKITSTQSLKISMIYDDSFELNGDAAVYYLPNGDATGGYAGGIPCVGERTGDATVVHVASGSGTLADPYVFAPGSASSTTAGYSVSLKEGTEDAAKWTINPNPAAEGQTVTATYSGTRRVKSVKAVKKSAAKTLAEVTAGDIGKIVGKDGKIYTTKADAEAVATGNAVAMIAYVGTASDCTHGLAIALADESGTKNYGDAGTACSGKEAVTGGTWRLPSEKDWQYMFIGCGSSESYSAPTEGMKKSYSGLASKLTTAQGDALQAECYYWSSTESNPSSHAWGVYIYGGGNAEFNAPNEGNALRVRACLAFTVEQVAEEPVMLAVPLTIEALTTGSIIVANPKAGMQYSLDGGATKNAVTTDAIPVAAGDKVQFYGDGTSITCYGDPVMDDCTMIGGDGVGFTCKVYGNIMSLLDEENFAKAETLSDSYTFKFLFFNNFTLTDASGLLLPATQLAESCYQQMFYNCTALIAAPALPAETLAYGCYQQMFASCSALTAAPVLPAKKLVMYCYTSMFNYCLKLATVTCLATSGINKDNSTSYWLNGAGSEVQGTKTVNTVSTANWPVDNNGGIPTDWTRVNIDN